MVVKVKMNTKSTTPKRDLRSLYCVTNAIIRDIAPNKIHFICKNAKGSDEPSKIIKEKAEISNIESGPNRYLSDDGKELQDPESEKATEMGLAKMGVIST